MVTIFGVFKSVNIRIPHTMWYGLTVRTRVINGKMHEN
jgi:hypothetical protein